MSRRCYILALLFAIMLLAACQFSPDNVDSLAAITLTPASTLQAVIAEETSNVSDPVTMTPAPTQTTGSDLGILTSPTPPLPPTQIAAASTRKPTQLNAQVQAANSGSGSQYCVVTSSTGSDINIYDGPGQNSAVIGTLGPYLLLDYLGNDGRGWYRVSFYPGEGWVNASEARLDGFCNGVQMPIATWVPSPTPFDQGMVMAGCHASPASGHDFVPLLSGPEQTFAHLGSMLSGQVLPVLARTDNGWYQIRGQGWQDEVIAFAPGYALAVEGPCANLPVMAASGFPVTPYTVELPPGTSPNDVVIPEGMCSVIAVGTPAKIYSQPNAASDVIGTLQPGPWMIATARSGSWYRLTLLNGGQGWVEGSTVQLNGPCDVPNTSTATPTPAPCVVHPQIEGCFTPNAPASTPIPGTPGPIQAGAWTHVTTVVEHGCDVPGQSTVGTSSLVMLSIVPSADLSSITLTYQTGIAFLLWRSGDSLTYSGSYGSPATVNVTLTFTSSTTYVADETVTHESGCVVRLHWVGTAG